MELTIPQVQDFAITGDGSRPAWDGVPWQELVPVGPGTAAYKTRVKLAWSPQGLYGLFDCADERLTCTHTRLGAFEEIYKEDVAELFLWPDEAQPLYFEYEISPLGMELPLLVPNNQGEFHGWTAFLATGKRQITSRTAIVGGEKAPGAQVKGWKAEFYIPFALLIGLTNCPPRPGTRWRGNACRIDYDTEPASHFSLSRETGTDFHAIQHFSIFHFQ